MKILKVKKIDSKIIKLSNEIFGVKKNMFQYKNTLWNFYTKRQFVLLLQNEKKVIGLIRVIKKKMYLKKKFYNIACITNVGIKKIFRKKGFSKFLINKSLNILKINHEGALLIARKKLDFFYNRFGFKGNSEFSEISINLKKKKTSNLFLKEGVFTPKTKKYYTQTYSKKNGYFIRGLEDWKLISFKLKRGKLKFINIFNNKKKNIGYFIFKDNLIVEYGFIKKNVREFYLALCNKFSNVIVIKNPTEFLINEIQKYTEISIKKRFCYYGGHMIYFFKNKKLNNLKYNINFLDEF